MPIRIAAESTEYVRVPVAGTLDGILQDPTVDVVQVAVFPDTQDEPFNTDWRTGDWETDNTQDPPIFYARVLVGPVATDPLGNPSPLPLTDGTWQVWVKIFDVPEVVVRLAGRVLIY